MGLMLEGAFTHGVCIYIYIHIYVCCLNRTRPRKLQAQATLPYLKMQNQTTNHSQRCHEISAIAARFQLKLSSTTSAADAGLGSAAYGAARGIEPTDALEAHGASCLKASLEHRALPVVPVARSASLKNHPGKQLISRPLLIWSLGGLINAGYIHAHTCVYII